MGNRPQYHIPDNSGLHFDVYTLNNDPMKYIIPTLLIGLFLASCAETEIPEPEKTQYNVRFEVECDSCQAFYAVNAEGNIGEWISGIYTKDTIAFSGDNCSVVGLVLESEGHNDSIDVRIFVNDNLVSSGSDYGTDSVDVLIGECEYYFE